MWTSCLAVVLSLNTMGSYYTHGSTINTPTLTNYAMGQLMINFVGTGIVVAS